MGQGCQHGVAVLAAGHLAVVPRVQGVGVQLVVVLGEELLAQSRGVSVEVLDPRESQGSGFRVQGSGRS